MDVLKQVNDIRKKLGLRPLVANQKLMVVAQQGVDLMVRKRQVGHFNFQQRINNSGYRYKWIGENAALSNNPVIAWANSPGHWKNMVYPQATETGWANSGRYWCMVYGAGQNKGAFFQAHFVVPGVKEVHNHSEKFLTSCWMTE